ncbi:MAG: hypothetical protein K0Q51_1409 [Rickettsiaceae bacterium]|jgi:DNA-nicking Smr family endonuclease|nr:hypothetical protein [Rickettsiaceae bacterium]
MNEMDDWFNSSSKPPPKQNDEAWADFKKEVEKLDKKEKASNIKKPNLRGFEAASPVPRLPDNNLSIQPFDYKIKRKITREKVAVEATLDLHGLAIDEAEKAVVEFILGCYKASKTYVLIITGKGELAATRATLRTEFPRFVSNPKISPIIISFTQAGRKHGFQGAFYVLLRKKL